MKLNGSGNSGWSFGVFPIFNNLVSRKRQVLERNIHLNLCVSQSYVVIVCHLVKQSAKAMDFLYYRYNVWTITTIQ